MKYRRGFTILEISIVTIVISLIVAGISLGQSMIRNANIRSVIIGFGEISKAVSSFKLQFNALPGDMTSSIYSNSNIPTYGNGNGIIESTSSACNSTESIIAWNHLYYTENYPGKLSGVSPSSVPCALVNVNVPASRVKNGFFFLWNSAGNSGSVFGVSKGNLIHFGKLSTSDNSVNGSIISASDAQIIDAKMDDNVANTGALFGIDGNDTTNGYCSGPWSGAGADYKYGATTISCRLVFWLDY
ncbi:MAG: type II secretion system protein [Alphaproteobacteria bacterium]